MGRIMLTALIPAVIMALCQTTAADDSAPIVKLRQPIDLVSFQCQCGNRASECDQCESGSQSRIYCLTPGCEQGGSGAHFDASSAFGGKCDSCSKASCDSCAANTCESAGAGCDSAGAGLDCDGAGLAGTCLGNQTACTDCGSGNCCRATGRGHSVTDDWDWACSNLCRTDAFWIRSDYLMWWMKGVDLPTLVSSSPLGTSVTDAGVLGLPTTQSVYGGSFFDDMRSGGRLRYGYRLNDCYQLGGSFWMLENDTQGPSWSSSGDPIYARPFFNVDPGSIGEDAQLISLDAGFDGTVRVDSSSELLGGDILLSCNKSCWSDPCSKSSRRVDWLIGYRYLKLREGVRITENLVTTGAGPFAVGTTIDLFDDFRTTNEFHGADFGASVASQHGRWTAEILGKVAIGSLNRRVRISGSESITVPTVTPLTTSGGLLTQSTNIGDFEDSNFGVLPEFQANIGYAVTSNLSFQVGYTFMFLGDMVRPGDAMDRNVNGTLLDDSVAFAGAANPQFAWQDSDFWVMGLNFGAEVRF